MRSKMCGVALSGDCDDRSARQTQLIGPVVPEVFWDVCVQFMAKTGRHVQVQ